MEQGNQAPKSILPLFKPDGNINKYNNEGEDNGKNSPVSDIICNRWSDLL